MAIYIPHSIFHLERLLYVRPENFEPYHVALFNYICFVFVNITHINFSLLVYGAKAPPPQWARASSFTTFLDHTQRRTTVGRTPLDEWSACRRDLYLTIHNTHNRHTSMPPVGIEPTISAGERSQIHTLDLAANGNDRIDFNVRCYLMYFTSLIDQRL